MRAARPSATRTASRRSRRGRCLPPRCHHPHSAGAAFMLQVSGAHAFPAPAATHARAARSRWRRSCAVRLARIATAAHASAVCVRPAFIRPRRALATAAAPAAPARLAGRGTRAPAARHSPFTAAPRAQSATAAAACRARAQRGTTRPRPVRLPAAARRARALCAPQRWRAQAAARSPHRAQQA